VRRSGLALVLALACGAGCTPDRWAGLQPEWTEPDPNDAAGAVAMPSDLAPVLPGESAPEPETDDAALEVSIEQVTMLALRNNRDLSVVQLNPVVAGTFEQIERGVYDPELFLELGYGEEASSETSRSTGEQFPVEARDTSGGLGVRQRLPTGTTVEASVEHEKSSSNRAPEQQSARIGLTVTQSLLRGLGPAVNLASVRQAELETQASVHELRGFTEALVADTEIAYWNHVLAQQEIAIFEESLAVAKRQRDEIEERIAVGMLPKTEVAVARAEVALREQALINARSLLEERRLRLVRLISPERDGSLRRAVRPTSEARIEPAPIADLDDRIALAERARPDLQEAKLRLEQNRLETVVTRNGVLPRLDLFVTLGKTGYADSFLDSFREIAGRGHDFEIGLSLGHALGNRAAKARDRAARTSWRQSAEAVANLEQIVRLDVRLAVNEVERARQQIAATAATRTLQEQTVEAERERFRVGASTGLLVAQAQRDLLLAQITEVEAVVQYRVALVRLYLAEGSLLERRGVRLDG